jgi:acetyl-CoA acyltransferase 1
VVGVPPGIMGVGPAYAIPSAVRAAGLQMGDIDVFEINEVCHPLCPILDRTIHRIPSSFAVFNGALHAIVLVMLVMDA